MITKRSYSVQMSYEVSDAEKAQAEKALLAFNYVEKLLKSSCDHLKIMETPFKDHPDISTEQVLKYRAALRRYRDKVIENFNNFKIASFKCVTLMQLFSSDTQTVKIMKSFINGIEDIEKNVNEFADLFSDLESKQFVPNAIQSISTIQQECEELEDIIDERIKTHLQSNILGKNWVDGVSDSLQMKLEKETPLMIDLFNERQKQLNEVNNKK